MLSQLFRFFQEMFQSYHHLKNLTLRVDVPMQQDVDQPLLLVSSLHEYSVQHRGVLTKLQGLLGPLQLDVEFQKLVLPQLQAFLHQLAQASLPIHFQ